MTTPSRPGGRVAEKASGATLNRCEVEGVISSWPLLRESAFGPSLFFTLDISTARTLIRFPVIVFDTLAHDLKNSSRAIRPGDCVRVKGKLSGTVRKYGRGARWQTTVQALEVEKLDDGGFTAQVVRDPETRRVDPEDFPAEVF